MKTIKQMNDEQLDIMTELITLSENYRVLDTNIQGEGGELAWIWTDEEKHKRFDELCEIYKANQAKILERIMAL